MKRFMPFTGRKKELDLLEELLEDALEYHGNTILVRGDIGVGKSRFLDQFAESIRDRGFHILHGRSGEDPSRTYSTISAMVEDFLCRGTRGSQWMTKYITPEMAVHFMNLMPSLRELYPVEVRKSVQTDTSSTTLAFLEFFSRLSRSRPLLIMLDDIQWMSDTSLKLLRKLADRIHDLPVLLIAGIRSTVENSTLDGIIEELSTGRFAMILQLENLTPGEVSDLVDSKLNCPTSDQFKEWLATISEGNPLYIKEILKTLIRQNIIRPQSDGDQWTVEDDYMDFNPSKTVESVVRYRLGILDAESMGVLECAAVIGDRFSIRTLTDLLPGRLSSAVMQPVNILVSTGMLHRDEDGYSFAHPLIRQVLYISMDVDSRRELHRRLASILELQPGHESETALHLTRDLLPEEETLELALQLFDIGMKLKNSALDYRRSWDCLKEARRIAGSTEVIKTDLLRITAELNYLSWIQGRKTLDRPETKNLLQELITHDLRVEALFTCHILFHSALGSQDLEQAEEYLVRGTELATEENSACWNFRAERPLLLRRKGLLKDSMTASQDLNERIPVRIAPEALYRVQTNMGLVSFLKGEPSTAAIHLRKARETVQDHGLLHRSVDSRLNLGLALMSTGKLDKAMTEFRESLIEVELAHREPLVAITLHYMGSCFLSKGDMTRARQCTDDAIRIAAESNIPRLQLNALLTLAKIHLHQGDTESAEKLADQIESDEMAEQLRFNSLILRARIALAEDRLDEAIDLADSAISLTEDSCLGTKRGIAMGLRGLIQLRRGNIDGALLDLSESRSLLTDKGEIPMMCEILIPFGLELGSSRGEDILMEGIELLKRMKAIPAIQALHRDVSARGSEFARALALTEEFAGEPGRDLTEIQTFGGLSIRHAEQLKEIPPKDLGSFKSRELLALLLLTGGTEGVTRDFLISHLWPEAPEKKALASLRVALTHLRRVIGSEAIIQDGPHLSLSGDLIHSDLWEFNSLLSEWTDYIRDGMDHAAENRARRAIELYRGDFLPEFYSTLLEDQQFKLQNEMRELLLWMAERHLNRMEHIEAVRRARRLLAMDPCSEKACRIIMKGLDNTGDRAAAMRQYKRLEKNLSSEFDTIPDSETVDLYQELLSSE